MKPSMEEKIAMSGLILNMLDRHGPVEILRALQAHCLVRDVHQEDNGSPRVWYHLANGINDVIRVAKGVLP